jgi:nicotinate dehydrogenase subunit B
MHWQPRVSPNPRAAQGNLLTGSGIAYMRYKQAENYVALAMEVTVDRTTGKTIVRRVVCPHKCGLIVNPDGLRNQVEGSIMQTLSRSLHEEVRFNRSRVTRIDWNSFPILTFPEARAIQVALIDRPDQPAFGAGEAAAAPVPPHSPTPFSMHRDPPPNGAVYGSAREGGVNQSVTPCTVA